MKAIPAFIPTISFESTTQSQRAGGTVLGPEHARFFEALADDSFTTGAQAAMSFPADREKKRSTSNAQLQPFNAKAVGRSTHALPISNG